LLRECLTANECHPEAGTPDRGSSAVDRDNIGVLHAPEVTALANHADLGRLARDAGTQHFERHFTAALSVECAIHLPKRAFADALDEL
jgi:hypothetical protein